MKTLFLTSLACMIFAGIGRAQIIHPITTNPDGSYPSIHLSGYSYKFDRIELINQFNYEVKLKIPLSNFFTFSAFYQRENIEINSSSTNNIISKNVRIGATVSYYMDDLFK